jgi:peptide-N4-(N-acetyl-beta-glucosaminyl)asparagine amidase
VCQKETRYPRYNKVTSLLETKSGRCGEWANTFTAVARAMGYETRLVHDLTDHVWTEVFIAEEDRWVHMDACENAFDAPKMYEQGWGKKLTYCFAINTEEVVDVTKRYVVNSWKNKLRRTAVPEGWLLNMLANVKVDIQA